MKGMRLARAAGLIAAAAAVGLLTPSAAFAVAAETPMATAPAAQSPAVDRASDLIGLPVRNEAGESLGTVSEIVLSGDGTKAESIALLPEATHGAVPVVYVPFSKFTRSDDGNALVCDLSPKRVMALSKKMELSPSWSRHASQLIGLEARDLTGHRLGTIRDLLISRETGEIVAATIGTRGFLGFGARLGSVEWMSVWLASAGHYATLSLTREEFNRLTYSEKKYWEQLGFSAPEEHMMRPDTEKDPFAPSVGHYGW